MNNVLKTNSCLRGQWRKRTKIWNVQMWELDHKEGWAPKNWCLLTVVLKKTLESPFDWKESKPVNFKRNQPWIFIERTDAKAEAPTLWPLDAKWWLFGKDLHAGKDWRQKVRWWDSIIDSMDMNLSKLWEIVENKEIWSATVHGIKKSRTQLSDWTTTV